MRRAIQPYADPMHEGNSERYHTGKRCTEANRKNPAGTMWSPHWCFKHNKDRMARIIASLKDAAERAEFNAKVREAAEGAWRYGHEMRGYLKAAVIAAGGTLTLRKEDIERDVTYESQSSNADGSTTFRFG